MISNFYDLNIQRRIHIVGVGGPGMSAVATALVDMGHIVSGSDIKNSVVIEKMRDLGVHINIGHDVEAVLGCDVVTYSTAVPSTNIELQNARERGLLIFTRAEILAAICALTPAIAVAGTHGKTTTTSLLVRIFSYAQLGPNFIVGGDVLDEGVGARWANSTWTIVEADESDGTHLQLPLVGTILTNIDSDHLDRYGDVEGIARGFEEYLRGISGPKVLCIDDPRLAEMAVGAETSTYGFGPEADFRCHSVNARDGLTTFQISTKVATGVSNRGPTTPDDNLDIPATIGIPVTIDIPVTINLSVTMTLRGRHNVLNATAAIALAHACGISLDVAARAVTTFRGVGRRFDMRGEEKGITFVDDYAHLPAEIAAVMQATRSSDDGWKRIVAVFQPNRFNRMAVISHEYANAFVDADVIVITDIYASGTQPIDGVSGLLVVEAIRESHPRATVHWMPSRDSLAEQVGQLLLEGDVCISMGCGDIETLPQEIMNHLSGKIVSVEDV